MALMLFYGASPEFSLTKLDDIIHPEAFIFVEDRVAEVWLREIIARHPDGGDILGRIRITSVGPANVVQMMGKLSAKGKLPYKGLGVLDGDTEISDGCIRLPGSHAPEKVVYGELKQKNWVELHQRFGVGAGDLFSYLDDTLLNPDFHRWSALIGNRIVKSSDSVWETIATEWCKECLSLSDLDQIVDGIRSVLNK